MRRGTSTGRWVIYFEGGGGCSNFSNCNQRYLDHPEQMSAPDLTSTIVGEDLLSDDPSKNPLFHDYSHVLVPYCSSDAWLGNRTIPRFESGKGFVFNNSDLENSNNFVYTGQAILRAVMEDLGEMGLENASDVVLVGSSAGGIGLLNSLEWINDRVPVNSSRVILDSSWFVDYTGHHVLQFNRQVAEVLNFSQPACHDLSLGYPCCVSPACLITRGYLDSTDTPILAISSLYDIFTLDQPLRELTDKDDSNDQALLALFNSYGAIVLETLFQSYKTHPRLSVYAPSCTQHVYLSPSSTLRETTQNVYEESVFRLTNPVKAGNWEGVRIETQDVERLTLLGAMEQWVNNSHRQLFHTDTCSGPACSICPSDITIEPKTNVWSPTWNYIVLSVAGLMTLVAVLIKIGTYLYMKYLLMQQKLYSISSCHSTRTRNFPKPTHPVNISCTELSHHIELVRGSAGSRTTTTTTNSLLFSEQPEVNPKLWNCCWSKRQSRAKLDSTVCSQSEMIHTNILRPDSGISSTEDSLVKTRKTKTREEIASDTNSNTSSDFDTRSFDPNPVELEPPTRKHRKTILNQVNLYINPGELVAIMGPSGSGKTTLLDVLLNKRTTGITDVSIIIVDLYYCWPLLQALSFLISMLISYIKLCISLYHLFISRITLLIGLFEFLSYHCSV